MAMANQPDDDGFETAFQITWSDGGKHGWFPERYATEEEALAAARRIEVENRLNGTWSEDAWWDVAEVDSSL